MNRLFFFKLLRNINLPKSAYYSARFQGKIFVGKNTCISIAQGAKITFSEKGGSLYVGTMFDGGGNTVLDLHRNSTLCVGRSVALHKGTKMVLREAASMQIGSRTFINQSSTVHCTLRISIGRDCAIGWCSNILDSDLHSINHNGVQINPDAPVTIGNKVWVGANSAILKGTTIEDNVILGINSLVSGRTLKSGRIYAGNPAAPIKEHDSWGSKP